MESFELQEDHNLRMDHKSTQYINELLKLVPQLKCFNSEKAAWNLLFIFGKNICAGYFFQQWSL